MVARSLAEPLEACCLRKVSSEKVPKYPEVLGRAIRRAPHMEPSFLTQNLGCPEQAGRATIAHQPWKVTHPGRPTWLVEP
jgi:hypothetical protein